LYCSEVYTIDLATELQMSIDMTSTPTNVSNYKAALVLNNTGVTLLQRQRYNDALTTFKDATDLMSCVRDIDRQPMGDEKATSFLEQASVRMSKSTRIGGGDPSKNASNCCITVINQGECSHTKDILSTFPELFHGFAYVLEYDEECIDVIADTAMLLHNFSVSIRMKVHYAGTRNQNIADNCKMMDFAYKVESAADKILNEYIATSAHDCDNDFPVRNCEESYQLAIVIVKDLILLSKAIQLEENEQTVQKYTEQLNQLRRLLLASQDSTLNSSLSKCKRAAHAA
jgi:hypothetical protein